MKFTVAVIGHFAYGKTLLNGQTIKTKIITEALEEQYGTNNVKGFDTHGGIRFLIKMPFMLWRVLKNSKNIVVMPAHNGIRIILPLLCFYNVIFRRNILYVVIGGWLPKMLEANGFLKAILKKIKGIFVETPSMKRRLDGIGLKNIYLMPNCKKLDIAENTSNTLPADTLPLCTFSRVLKEKGIAEAIEAVKKANNAIGRNIYSLDIYGQVDEQQKNWFKQLMDGQPEYIQYQGCASFDKSSDVLRNYYALLFPTYYQGEGFAGTIIDAFAAGLPVLATDWHDNADIIKHGVTGFIYPIKDSDAISTILLHIFKDRSIINDMRSKCINEAKLFMPHVVIKALTKHIL